MSSVRGLYERFRHLIHEGAKFLVIGAFGTIVTFGVANVLHNSLGKYGAITVATALATAVTFVGNRYWTFKHRQGQGTTRDTVLFFILNGIGLVIYYCCLGITDAAGLTSKLWYNAALVVGTVLGTLFRFWSYRKWVWVAADDTPVLMPGESDAERAQDLAAIVGAAPVAHHLAEPAKEPASQRPTL